MDVDADATPNVLDELGEVAHFRHDCLADIVGLQVLVDVGDDLVQFNHVRVDIVAFYQEHDRKMVLEIQDKQHSPVGTLDPHDVLDLLFEFIHVIHCY